jgi:hypothetical protein
VYGERGAGLGGRAALRSACPSRPVAGERVAGLGARSARPSARASRTLGAAGGAGWAAGFALAVTFAVGVGASGFAPRTACARAARGESLRA